MMVWTPEAVIFNMVGLVVGTAVLAWRTIRPVRQLNTVLAERARLVAALAELRDAK